MFVDARLVPQSRRPPMPNFNNGAHLHQTYEIYGKPHIKKPIFHPDVRYLDYTVQESANVQHLYVDFSPLTANSQRYRARASGRAPSDFQRPNKILIPSFPRLELAADASIEYSAIKKLWTSPSEALGIWDLVGGPRTLDFRPGGGCTSSNVASSGRGPVAPSHTTISIIRFRNGWARERARTPSPPFDRMIQSNDRLLMQIAVASL
ncbi:hypothetical protein CC2G_006802 [Coprinopsis cinerea AmutBmut pab1-1]|nr:hypothetical protein CC2G_006802 [Coprinopsis cinerea AmutBmut pab1-1]